jgi:hypothetical protein
MSAEIQHAEAPEMLALIESAYWKGKTLTYGEAARALGRSENHGRAMAQICDLLDAATCLAGVPLIALIQVRGSNGEINEKAWRDQGEARRLAIIDKSLRHKFTPAEFPRIAQGLRDLKGRGNRAAWTYVKGLYPGDLIFRRLMGDYGDQPSNAVDDLGSDSPERQRTSGWAYPRDPRVREEVMRRAEGKCEYCGTLGFKDRHGNPYLESHHIIALANEGEDRLTNVIALCANHHREAHFGANSERMEEEMIGIVQRTV